MDSDQVRLPRYFSVSMTAGRLSLHPGGYVFEDQFDMMLRMRQDAKKIHSGAELDEALTTSKDRPLPVVTLWVLAGLEEDVRARQNRSG